MVLGLIFTFLIHFEFILGHGVTDSSSNSFAHSYPVFPGSFTEDFVFPTVILASFVIDQLWVHL